MKIDFLGASQTVTGSKYLLTEKGRKILVDCGLFQGLKDLRLKNWAAFPIEPSEISAILLTHAHLDHSGYIPLLVKSGFRGPIYCTAATKELARVLLLDSGYLQEEEAKFANKRGYSKHHPAQPLYTLKDAETAMNQFEVVDWNTDINIADVFKARFSYAGHLLGAASVLVYCEGKKILFSGDLGRSNDPIMKPPEPPPEADYVVVESTYGNRVHPDEDVLQRLKEVIERTIDRGGTVLIPSFAAGRAQVLLYYLKYLIDHRMIAPIPVYLNSPMAQTVNGIFKRFSGEHRLGGFEAEAVCRLAKTVGTPQESIALNEDGSPKIIIAASGMASGGRVLHHLKTLAPNARNTILFAGFQAAGTRGEALVNGAEEIKIHGQFWRVNADVINLESLSAHADGPGVLEWLKSMGKNPKHVFITHGEPNAAEALATSVRKTLDVETSVPALMSSVSI